MIENRIFKFLVFGIGLISVTIGVVGAFLPLLPTTPFLLLAAICFLNSSEKAHQWLYRQPVLGPALQDWETNRSISRKTKILAITMILISLITIWIKVSDLWIKLLATTSLILISLFIISRSEKSK